MNRAEIKPGWYAIVIKGRSRSRDPSWYEPLHINSVHHMVSCRKVKPDTGEFYGGNKNIMADDIVCQYADYETARKRGELARQHYDEETSKIRALEEDRDRNVKSILRTGWVI